jgi:hypothetical protein
MASPGLLQGANDIRVDIEYIYPMPLEIKRFTILPPMMPHPTTPISIVLSPLSLVYLFHYVITILTILIIFVYTYMPLFV